MIEESIISWAILLMIAIVAGVIFFNKIADPRTPEEKFWDKLLEERRQEHFQTWSEVHNVSNKCRWWMHL